MKSGPIFDRGLSIDVLDAALQIARAGAPYNESLRLLEVALQDFTSGQSATTKTRTILSRVWIRPPEYSKQVVDWLLGCEPIGGDSRISHFGAILASYPFFGEVCAYVGRQLNMSGEVNALSARKHMYATWGERSSVDVGVIRCIRTLRRLGVLTGHSGTSRSVMGDVLEVPPQLRNWIVHSLMLTRLTDSIDERDVDRAPELFMLQMAGQPDDYPNLERVNEGGGRRVLIIRGKTS